MEGRWGGGCICRLCTAGRSGPPAEERLRPPLKGPAHFLQNDPAHSESAAPPTS